MRRQRLRSWASCSLTSLGGGRSHEYDFAYLCIPQVRKAGYSCDGKAFEALPKLGSAELARLARHWMPTAWRLAE